MDSKYDASGIKVCQGRRATILLPRGKRVFVLVSPSVELSESQWVENTDLGERHILACYLPYRT